LKDRTALIECRRVYAYINLGNYSALHRGSTQSQEVRQDRRLLSRHPPLPVGIKSAPLTDPLPRSSDI